MAQPRESAACSACTSRRDFLKVSAQALGLATLGGLRPTLRAQANPSAAGNILVLIHLAGGNDGLNTVIPRGDDRYAVLRPTLAINPDQVLPLDDASGFHPACLGLHDLFMDGRLAVLNQVGAPAPNFSHFGALEQWATGHTTARADNPGWIGRYFDEVPPSPGDPAAVHFSPALPASLRCESEPEVFSFNAAPTDGIQVNRSVERIVAAFQPISEFPSTVFAANLRRTAALIASGTKTPIYHLTLPGFDTHSHQAIPHAQLLRTLAEGLAAFDQELRYRRLDHRVLTLAWSEFGRSARENERHGTDHGTFGPVFALGGKVRGGLIGAAQPASAEAVVPEIDFRAVYATVLARWLQTDPVLILGREFDLLDFV